MYIISNLNEPLLYLRCLYIRYCDGLCKLVRVCVFVCARVCVCLDVSVCLESKTHTCSQTDKHTYTQTDTLGLDKMSKSI